MKHATFFITQSQYNWLAATLPVPVTKTKQVIPNYELLNGILFVLKTGCRWQDIPSSICLHGYSSCWRRLNFWCTRQLKLTWQRILLVLDHEDKLDLSLGNMDGTLVQSPQYDGVGYDSQHHRYGVNISLLTGKNGLPVVSMTFKGNRNDIVTAEATMNRLRVGAKRKVKELNADKGYDSKAFLKLRYRYERKRGMFQAVVDLTCLLICLRQGEY